MTSDIIDSVMTNIIIMSSNHFIFREPQQ